MATLSGLCILKLVSWKDKPEIRKKDIDDLVNIVEHYFDLESEEIYSKILIYLTIKILINLIPC